MIEEIVEAETIDYDNLNYKIYAYYFGVKPKNMILTTSKNFFHDIIKWCMG